MTTLGNRYHSQLSRTNGSSFHSALDVGCGSGQSTMGLLKYWDTVTGVETSTAQIEKALKNNNPKVSFRVGAAADLSFIESGSVDLVTTAQAVH